MDHFGEAFADRMPLPKTRKSSSSKEKSPLKEKVSAVNLEKIVVPIRESKIVIINPVSPRTIKMRKDLEEQRKQSARDRPISPKVAITNPNPLRLNMSRRSKIIDASIDIEDTTRFPIGRTKHNCFNIISNCRSITQANHRGSYSILYNDGHEIVIPTFNQLVKFITDDYMTTRKVPYNKRAELETRIREFLNNNEITAAAKGGYIKTRKNKKHKGTKRKGKGKK